MKAFYENIESKKGSNSFVAYHSVVPYFEFKWHYHPEYEIAMITSGEGKRLVGDSYENFYTGDLVLLGSGLPHTWASEPAGKKNVSAVVIQFSEAFIGSFLQFDEFSEIRKLLDNASMGLHFPKESYKDIAQDIENLPYKEGVERVTALIEILRQLALKRPVPLASEFYTPARKKENEVRINKVCGYIQKHSGSNISLERAASLVHMSPSAFCKFFKRVTAKTFSDYVNDIRIGNACRMLTESDNTISEIAFASGFESLTYFNRVFMKKKGLTPGNFRKNLRQSNS